MYVHVYSYMSTAGIQFDEKNYTRYLLPVAPGTRGFLIRYPPLFRLLEEASEELTEISSKAVQGEIYNCCWLPPPPPPLPLLLSNPTGSAASTSLDWYEDATERKDASSSSPALFGTYPSRPNCSLSSGEKKDIGADVNFLAVNLMGPPWLLECVWLFINIGEVELTVRVGDILVCVPWGGSKTSHGESLELEVLLGFVLFGCTPCLCAAPPVPPPVVVGEYLRT